MILALGLSLTVVSTVACSITHPKFSDVKNDHWDAINNKNAYLDAYKLTDEFKTSYNTDINALNERLIARKIDAYTYENELEKLDSNEYTEQVIVENADEQTKAEFNELNQKYLDTKAEWEKQATPSVISCGGAFAMPMVTAGLYYIWKPKKKHNEHEVDFEHHISEDAFKRVMKLKDMPPYHPINASENQKVTTYYAYDHKEEKAPDTTHQENNNTLNQ